MRQAIAARPPYLQDPLLCRLVLLLAQVVEGHVILQHGLGAEVEAHALGR